MKNLTPRKLTPEQETTLIARYRAGETPGDIWLSLGVSKRTFYNTLLRHNATPLLQQTKLSEEDRKRVADRYRAGESSKTLAHEFSLNPQTVYNILTDYNVDVRQPGKRLSAEERLLVVEQCLSGGHANDVAAKFGISPETVFMILREHDVSLPKGRPKAHEINDAIFDVLTPESLYWMGFLFTDGCVHRDDFGQSTLVCGLGEKDLGHLEKLRAFCGSTHKIYHQNAKARRNGDISVPDRTIVYWRVRSNRICNALESRGIVTKRTRVPVPELAESRDFWRGCVDGDGSVGISDRYPNIRLAGQVPLLSTFQSFLVEKTGIALNITKAGMRNGSVFEVRSSGSKALRIIELLYKDATIALERKNARAQSLLRGELNHFDPYENPARTKV